MAKEIELPDGSIAEFPDDMDDASIRGVLQKKFPAKATPAAGPSPYQPYQGIDPAADTERFGENPGTGGRVLPRALTGLADPIYGAAQIADKAINPIRQRLSPGASSMEDVIRQRDAEYQSPEGFDAARLVGNMANPINYMGASAPIRAGAMTAMLQPTAADDMTLRAKAQQAMIGGGAGGVARVLGSVRQGAKPTEDALQMQLKMEQSRGRSVPTPVLTPGQLANPEGWLRKTEEALADVPFVGAPLRKRQEDALRGFQEWSRHIASPAAADNTSASTIAGIKQSFNDGYRTILSGQKVGNVSAIGMHEMEKNMRREAGQFIKSLDPEQQKIGFALKDKADEFAQQWRGQLSEDTRGRVAGLDEAYANFAPIKEASKKTNATLVTPENYTPAAVLKQLRNRPNSDQAEFARQAERAIGSIPPKSTLGGGMGLGGVGIMSILTGQHIPASVGAGLAAGYGTKTGQKVARGAQRLLTADETAAISNALRRGAVPALAGKQDD